MISRSPRVVLDGKVAEEVWTGNAIDYYERVFGCPTYAHITGEERSKLDAKSRQCIFRGYQKRVKDFKLWDSKSNKVVINRDVVFDEKAMVQKEEKQALENYSSDDHVVHVELELMQGDLVRKINNITV